jgi:hypothetical protein
MREKKSGSPPASSWMELLRDLTSAEILWPLRKPTRLGWVPLFPCRHRCLFGWMRPRVAGEGKGKPRAGSFAQGLPRWGRGSFGRPFSMRLRKCSPIPGVLGRLGRVGRSFGRSKPYGKGAEEPFGHLAAVAGQNPPDLYRRDFGLCLEKGGLRLIGFPLVKDRAGATIQGAEEGAVLGVFRPPGPGSSLDRDPARFLGLEWRVCAWLPPLAGLPERPPVLENPAAADVGTRGFGSEKLLDPRQSSLKSAPSGKPPKLHRHRLRWKAFPSCPAGAGRNPVVAVAWAFPVADGGFQTLPHRARAGTGL